MVRAPHAAMHHNPGRSAMHQARYARRADVRSPPKAPHRGRCHPSDFQHQRRGKQTRKAAFSRCGYRCNNRCMSSRAAAICAAVRGSPGPWRAGRRPRLPARRRSLLGGPAGEICRRTDHVGRGVHVRVPNVAPIISVVGPLAIEQSAIGTASAVCPRTHPASAATLPCLACKYYPIVHATFL
jgi:hypothetical protein